MSMAPTIRRGMTLIELLVVVAIIGVLAVTVLPNVAGIAESRRSREAARAVSAFVAKAQSRAVGRREWSGFMIAAVSASTASFVATDLTLVDMPPVYRGETVPALVAVTGSLPFFTTSGTVITGTIPGALRVATGTAGTLSVTAAVSYGDLIRFDGRGPFYEISGTVSSAVPVTGTSVTFRLRGSQSGAAEDVGNEQFNTPWPPLSVPLPGASGTTRLAFEILRQPVPSGSPLSLADGRVIDLMWSGCGPPTVTTGTVTLNTYRPFVTGTVWTGGAGASTGGASTSVLFDGTGRLRQVVVRSGTTTSRQAVTGPVFLLIGRADRAGQAYVPLSSTDDTVGANWQYQDSFWVAIDQATGVAKTAECTTVISGSTVTTVTDSQLWIRQSLFAEGR